MHGNHITIANFTLILGAGTLIVAGFICSLSSQVRTLLDFFKDRARHRHSS
jgi:hypothetical protein